MKKVAQLIKNHLSGKESKESNRLFNEISAKLVEAGYKAPFKLRVAQDLEFLPIEKEQEIKEDPKKVIEFAEELKNIIEEINNYNKDKNFLNPEKNIINNVGNNANTSPILRSYQTLFNISKRISDYLQLGEIKGDTYSLDRIKELENKKLMELQAIRKSLMKKG